MINNICPIIIVGSGKAALLHLNAYIRLWENRELPQIYIVQGCIVNPQIGVLAEKYPLHIQFITLQKAAALKLTGSIVDICTPTATHRTVLEELYSYGFARFIVEKPLVTTTEDLESIKSLKIRLEIMQNYMFSQATLRAIDLIQSNEIMPKSMVSFFCKDRTQDSIEMRGFNGDEPPHVFTIELPHQLYLATKFLGPAKLSSVYCENMNVNGNTYINHGTGVINLEHYGGHRDSSSFHFSCLTSESAVRRVIITSYDGKILTIDYPISKNNLTSSIEIKSSNGIIKKEVFENDDMLKMAIEYYCTFLSQDSVDYTTFKYCPENWVLLVTKALSKE